MYNTGYEFFKDLCSEYGIEEAVKIANSYLDLPNRKNNPDEYSFCCELYNAVQQATA